MNLFSTAALAYAAMTCLAMASERYRHGAHGPAAPALAWLRGAGWALLAIAALPAAAGWCVSVGLALWIAVTGFAAFCCTLLISFRPSWVPHGGLLSLAAGLAGLALG